MEWGARRWRSKAQTFEHDDGVNHGCSVRMYACNVCMYICGVMSCHIMSCHVNVM